MKTIEGKVVVLGAQGVGKTSMIVRHVGRMFSHHQSPTIGASFFNCKVTFEDAKVHLQVWDTAGQERFRSMAPMYYRNANVALLVFDLTQFDSFVNMKSWVTELRRNVEGVMVIALVGNKSDLSQLRVVDAEEATRYATSIGATYHETSALQDEGIEQVFLTAAYGLVKLSSGEEDLASNLRVYDSGSSCPSSPNMPLSPSSEEGLANTSIAHGIHEKPYMCC